MGNYKTADDILQMIQRNTVNGRLPFQISTGLGTMVTPQLLNVNGSLPFQNSTGLGTTVTPQLPMVTPQLPMVTTQQPNVNPQVCDCSCSGLNAGQAAGLGIGLLIVGLACGILGTLLVLLVIRLCCSKSSPRKDAPVNYEPQKDEVEIDEK